MAGAFCLFGITLYYGQVLIQGSWIHETGVLVVSHAVEKADCFEQVWCLNFAEAGFKHLDSGGAIVAVDSGQSLNPILERYCPGLICISAFPDIEN